MKDGKKLSKNNRILVTGGAGFIGSHLEDLS
jgi:nucleoside-diphosphate-sugar epimerase